MKKIFQFCWKYLVGQKGSITFYIVICILNSLASVALPYISGNFVDQLVLAKNTKFLYGYVFIFIIFNIVNLVFGYIITIMNIKLQTQVAFKLNTDAIRHVQRVPLNLTKNQNTTYLTQKINNDSNSLITFCIGVIQNIIINVVKLAVAVVFIFLSNSYLAGILIILNMLYYVSYRIFKKHIFKLNYEFKEEQAHFFNKLNEQLFNIKFIQIHGVGQAFIERLNKSFYNLLNKILKYQKLSYLFSSTDNLIFTCSNVFIFIFGGISVINGTLSIGNFIIISTYFNVMMSATKYFFMLGQTVQENMVSYNRMRDLFNTNELPNGNKILDSIDSITVKNLTFSYGDNCIFNNFSAKFKKGKIYALTGENGSGKSTLLYIILGLYIDELIGEVLYNDINIRQLDMIEIRKKLIKVSEQEPLLLNDSLKYNITLDEQVSLDERQLKKLFYNFNLDEFVSSLTDGIDTIINEKSSNLSGGEKQKISLIRAAFHNSNVLILDEPTSALDRESQVILKEYLNSVRNNKIVFISTHCKELIDICDIEIHFPLSSKNKNDDYDYVSESQTG